MSVSNELFNFYIANNRKNFPTKNFNFLSAFARKIEPLKLPAPFSENDFTKKFTKSYEFKEG